MLKRSDRFDLVMVELDNDNKYELNVLHNLTIQEVEKSIGMHTMMLKIVSLEVLKIDGYDRTTVTYDKEIEEMLENIN